MTTQPDTRRLAARYPYRTDRALRTIDRVRASVAVSEHDALCETIEQQAEEIAFLQSVEEQQADRIAKLEAVVAAAWDVITSDELVTGFRGKRARLLALRGALNDVPHPPEPVQTTRAKRV